MSLHYRSALSFGDTALLITSRLLIIKNMHTEHTGVLAYVARCLNTPASGTVLHIQCYIFNIIACAIELKGRHILSSRRGALNC